MATRLRGAEAGPTLGAESSMGAGRSVRSARGTTAWSASATYTTWRAAPPRSQPDSATCKRPYNC